MVTHPENVVYYSSEDYIMELILCIIFGSMSLVVILTKIDDFIENVDLSRFADNRFISWLKEFFDK